MPNDAAATQGWDAFRQVANVILAFAMPIVTVIAFSTGTSFEEATKSTRGTPLIEPAGYAFIIWTFIYGGAVVYSLYQARPSMAANQLLRDIGWWTASAFLGTSAWLVMARFGQTWLTVVCIVWMLLSLAPAFAKVIHANATLDGATYYLVAWPISIFVGWVTLATFANSAAAIKESGWIDAGLSEEHWTIILLLDASLVAASATFVSRGNVVYALTIVWGLAAIAVANLQRGMSLSVALTAASMAVAMVVVLLIVRIARPIL